MKQGNKPERLLCMQTFPNAVIYYEEVIRHGHNSNNDCSFIFRASWQNCEKKRILTSRPSACLSVRMEQLGSHWADFHEI
jgi:hypothetical protein